MIIIGTLESKINKTKILRSDLWFLKLQLSLKSDSNVPMDGDRGPYIFLGGANYPSQTILPSPN